MIGFIVIHQFFYYSRIFQLFVLFCIMHVKKVQAQCIGDNTEAGQAHGRRTEHRV